MNQRVFFKHVTAVVSMYFISIFFTYNRVIKAQNVPLFKNKAVKWVKVRLPSYCTT